MKSYQCLVPGCPWHTESAETAEIVRRAAEHMRTTHDEETVRPSLIEQIKLRIKAVEPAHR